MKITYSHIVTVIPTKWFARVVVVPVTIFTFHFKSNTKINNINTKDLL